MKGYKSDQSSVQMRSMQRFHPSRPNTCYRSPMRFPHLVACLPLVVCALACDPEGGIALRCRISDMSVAVHKEGLGTYLQGSFDVFCKLGDRASSATDVSFTSFSLVRTDQGLPAINKEHLSVVTSTPLPLHLEQGESATVPFEIGDQDLPGGPVKPMTLSKDDLTMLCASGLVSVVVSVQEGVDGSRPQVATSEGFLPTGCPE